MNDNDWVSCRWKLSELNQQRVEFSTDPQHTIQDGIGEFLVRQRPDGRMVIEISVDVTGPKANERTDHRWILDQEQADAIIKHPNPDIAVFKMCAARGKPIMG